MLLLLLLVLLLLLAVGAAAPFLSVEHRDLTRHNHHQAHLGKRVPPRQETRFCCWFPDFPLDKKTVPPNHSGVQMRDITASRNTHCLPDAIFIAVIPEQHWVCPGVGRAVLEEMMFWI